MRAHGRTRTIPVNTRPPGNGLLIAAKRLAAKRSCSPFSAASGGGRDFRGRRPCAVAPGGCYPARDPRDAPALRAIDDATWSPDMSPAPRPAPGKQFFSGRTSLADVLVARVDDAVAGYVALGAVLPLESNSHVVEIRGLAVDPARQGRGLGGLLLDAAGREASARGARKLSLRVLAVNTAARRLYEAYGFEVEGVLREEFLIEGRYVDSC